MHRQFVLLLALLGCGGVADDRDASADAHVATDDAGYTQCAAPDQMQVCGTSNCPDDSICDGCMAGDSDGLSVCSGKDAQGDRIHYTCQPCIDGDVCFQIYSDQPNTWVSGPYSIGVLFTKNGASSRARYCDLGTFTGDPLPMPTTCPTVAGIEFCGGYCGQCGSGERCVGRSPLHPYGFCVDGSAVGDCKKANPNCGGGLSCFTFTVQPEAQALADQHGVCIAPSLCASLAAGLPGGGTCSP